MMVVEGFLAARQSSLQSAVRAQKLQDAPAGTTTDWRRQSWANTAAIPMIADMNETTRNRAFTLAEPVPVAATDAVDDTGNEPPSRWQVTSDNDSKVKFLVDFKAFAEGKYDKACSCGMTSSSWVCACPWLPLTPPYLTSPLTGLILLNVCAPSQWLCKHYRRCVTAAREYWQRHVKPWQRPEAWERAVGDTWEPINFSEIAQATRALARRGDLMCLKEAQLSINRKGAPTNKEVAGMEERAKSFLESLGADALAEKETRQVMSGASGARDLCVTCTCHSPLWFLVTFTITERV